MRIGLSATTMEVPSPDTSHGAAGEEALRVAALQRYDILDTAPERAFDSITELAAQIFQVPIALVSLVDSERQWFKSRVGLGFSQTPRQVAFCDFAVRERSVLIVPDATLDARFRDNPLVTGTPGIRFYAGAPLICPEGHALGTLCIIDRKTRDLDQTQQAMLRTLAAQVSAQLELRLKNGALSIAMSQIRTDHALLLEAQRRARVHEERMERVLQASLDGWWDWNLETGEFFCSPHGWAMLGLHDRALPYGRQTLRRLVDSRDIKTAFATIRQTRREGGQYFQLQIRLLHASGRVVPALCRVYLQRNDGARVVRISGANTDLTEANRLHSERVELEKSFTALFENSLDGVLLTKPDGRILSANPAAGMMLRCTPAEVCALGRDGVVDTSDPRLPALLARRLQHGRALGELRMRRRDGSLFEAEVSTAIYRNANGEEFANVSFRDITERRRWQEQLERSLSLLDNLAKRVPGVLYQYQLFPDGRSCFPFTSEGIARIYELAPEQVRADAAPVWDRLHPGDRLAVAEAIAESARTQQPWSQEFRVLLPQQGECWRHGTAQPERLPDGSVLWHGFITDISDRKRAEEALRRLNRALGVLSSCNVLLPEIQDEEQYLSNVCRSVVDAGGYVMCWIGYAQDDPSLPLRVVAQAGCDLDYLDGIRVTWDGDHPSGRGVTGTAIREGTVQINRDMLRNDAMLPWREAALKRGFRSSVAVPLLSGRRVLGALSLYAEDTDTFSEDDRPLLEELGRSIGAALAALRSRREREEAENANRAKSAFLANISHEIRTPLNAIIGLCHLLLEDGGSSVQVGRLRKMNDAGRHLLSLVNDVLDFSKIEAEGMTLEQCDFQLSEVIDGVMAIVTDAAQAKGLKLEVRCQGVANQLRGDSMRLKQALLNFVTNAVKFTDAGTVAICVEGLEDGELGILLRFSVRDTGIGISAEDLMRLFQPFEQGNVTVARRFGGTGLGLAISRRLANLMGGEAGADSIPGVGSTFWFTARLQRGVGDLGEFPRPAPPHRGGITGHAGGQARSSGRGQ